MWFETACDPAAPAGLAGRSGSGVSSAEAAAAMALIRKAIAMGCGNREPCRTEDALDPLRSRDDFHLLMTDPAMPGIHLAKVRASIPSADVLNPIGFVPRARSWGSAPRTVSDPSFRLLTAIDSPPMTKDLRTA